MPSPTLTEDTIDDILYLARANELSELQACLDEVSSQTGASRSDIVSAARDPDSGNTALHYAAANGHVDIIRFVLSIYPATSTAPSRPGASNIDVNPIINALNSSGNTPLHWAALNGHLECVKALMAAGADVTIFNAAGHDAVFEAEINDKRDVVDWLLGQVEELEKGITKEGGEGQEEEGASEGGEGSSDNLEGVRKGIESMKAADGNAHG